MLGAFCQGCRKVPPFNYSTESSIEIYMPLKIHFSVVMVTRVRDGDMLSSEKERMHRIFFSLPADYLCLGDHVWCNDKASSLRECECKFKS